MLTALLEVCESILMIEQWLSHPTNTVKEILNVGTLQTRSITKSINIFVFYF